MFSLRYAAVPASSVCSVDLSSEKNVVVGNRVVFNGCGYVNLLSPRAIRHQTHSRLTQQSQICLRINLSCHYCETKPCKLCIQLLSVQGSRFKVLLALYKTGLLNEICSWVCIQYKA